MMASATELDGLVLADDALVQDLVQAQQLLAARPPGAGLTGMPVQAETISAISSSVTTSRSSRCWPCFGGQLLLLGRQPPFQLGQAAVAQLGGPVEVVGPLGLLGLVADLLQLLAQLLHPADGLALGLPLGPHRVGLGAQVGQLPPQLLQAGLAGRVGLLGQRRLLDLQPRHPAGQLVQLGRHRVDLGAQPGAGLVHQVDGLVGQEPVGDVAVAQGGGGDQGAVLDPDAVEHLQPLPQPAQDRDGVLDGRARRPAPAGSGAPGRRPSRCACGTRRGWWRRSCGARRGPAWA